MASTIYLGKLNSLQMRQKYFCTAYFIKPARENCSSWLSPAVIHPEASECSSQPVSQTMLTHHCPCNISPGALCNPCLLCQVPLAYCHVDGLEKGHLKKVQPFKTPGYSSSVCLKLSFTCISKNVHCKLFIPKGMQRKLTWSTSKPHITLQGGLWSVSFVQARAALKRKQRDHSDTTAVR